MRGNLNPQISCEEVSAVRSLRPAFLDIIQCPGVGGEGSGFRQNQRLLLGASILGAAYVKRNVRRYMYLGINGNIETTYETM